MKVFLILFALGLFCCGCNDGIKWTSDKYITVGRMCCDRCSLYSGLNTVSERIYDDGTRVYRCFCNDGVEIDIGQSYLDEIWNNKKNKCGCEN